MDRALQHVENTATARDALQKNTAKAIVAGRKAEFCEVDGIYVSGARECTEDSLIEQIVGQGYDVWRDAMLEFVDGVSSCIENATTARDAGQQNTAKIVATGRKAEFYEVDGVHVWGAQEGTKDSVIEQSAGQNHDATCDVVLGFVDGSSGYTQQAATARHAGQHNTAKDIVSWSKANFLEVDIVHVRGTLEGTKDSVIEQSAGQNYVAGRKAEFCKLEILLCRSQIDEQVYETRQKNLSGDHAHFDTLETCNHSTGT